MTSVSQALWADKQDLLLRERFRRQARAVYAQAIQGRDWPKRAEEVAANLKAKLLPLDAQEAARAERRGIEGAAQVRRRLEVVRAQFEDAAKLDAPGGAIPLAPYLWNHAADRGEIREIKADGRDCLLLKKTAPEGRVDARLPLALAPGNYRFTANIRTRGIAGGPGFRLRLGGEGDRTDLPGLTGDHDWSEVAGTFTVTQGDPTLVLELRAAAGEAWVDRASLRLTRLP